MLLLRQLFAVAGGGPETDAFKHLAAAFTVLRSLGSAKTATNSESSRIVSLFFRYLQIHPNSFSFYIDVLGSKMNPCIALLGILSNLHRGSFEDAEASAEGTTAIQEFILESKTFNLRSNRFPSFLFFK